MKIVVDTNILFSFFWEESLTRRLLITCEFQLISPEIALKELKKYSKHIMAKTGINQTEFIKKLTRLKQTVKFTGRKDYYNFINKAERISPDKDDAEFFALCLKNSCFLWSNDALLKQQSKIKVISTKDIIDILF